MAVEQTKHEYGGDFYEYINSGSGASASVICPLLVKWLNPASVLDVGCGAGAWCRVWMNNGIGDLLGVDGDYVNRDSLLIPRENFGSHDLAQSFDAGRKFDLVVSLEVAEHVPESSAATFVENLVRHGDCILFSAAVPGQGGEFHVNEQPLSYWRELFSRYGFECFDPIRPLVVKDFRIEPWYRYNTLLYVRASKVPSLPDEIRKHRIGAGQPISELAPLSWRMRNSLIRVLPKTLVDGLVQVKHNWGRRKARILR